MKLKIGVRAHDLSEKQTVDELVNVINKYNFKNIQLVFNKALIDYSYSDEYVLNVVNKLKENNIEVTMLGAYFNPVHSHRDVVEKGILNFKENLRISHYFPSIPYVGSETGSYNDSPWIYHPKNQTEEGYQETKKVFMDLKDYAESIGSKIAIESAWGHVIYSYEQHARLLQELNSDNVFATIDLYNLLCVENFKDRDDIFFNALKTMGNKVKIIHIKDADVIDNKLIQLSPGEGKFNYKFMIDTVKKYSPDATLIFEGVKADKIESSLKLIEKLM